MGVKTTKKLFATQKLKLSSLFNIPMPDNSTRYGEITKEKQNEMSSEVSRQSFCFYLNFLI